MAFVAEGDNSTKTWIFPLRDWIDLNRTHLRKSIHVFSQDANNKDDARNPVSTNQRSRCNNDEVAQTAKHARSTCASYSIRVANLLIDRLVRSEELDIPNNIIESFEAEHIATKNFLVSIPLPNEITFTGPPSVSEITQQLDRKQMESILKECVEVKLVPTLQNIVGFQIDEAIEREFYRKIGLLFFELFTGETTLPPQFRFYENSKDAAN